VRWHHGNPSTLILLCICDTLNVYLAVLAVDAVPCRIAFERGKERHFCFLALSDGTTGWILLLEELPLKQERGIVRVSAPLAGSDVSIMYLS
jgi:protein CLEC16A